MFNTYITRPSHVHVTERREVTEKRAPTDESVRLLREMEQAAENKLVNAVRIRSNKFDAKAFVFYDAPFNQNRVRIVFGLNEVNHDFTIDVDDYNQNSEAELVEFLRKAIAERIAEHLMVAVSLTSVRSILGRR